MRVLPRPDVRGCRLRFVSFRKLKDYDIQRDDDAAIRTSACFQSFVAPKIRLHRELTVRVTTSESTWIIQDCFL